LESFSIGTDVSDSQSEKRFGLRRSTIKRRTRVVSPLHSKAKLSIPCNLEPDSQGRGSEVSECVVRKRSAISMRTDFWVE
jgi:hypothetical protein